jgi:hypothetical protein
MAAETSSTPSGRPRTWLLVALGIAVVVAAAPYVMTGKSAAPTRPPSNPRAQGRVKTPETVKPEDLDVRIGELRRARPEAQASERNPFRFYVKPPPPPPPPGPSSGRGGGEAPVFPPQPVGPPPPPPPPPIPLKFIGTLDVPNLGKLAVFSDCRTTMRGKEGDIIDGRYRLVRIGVESVTMEYADGKGRTTIRMSGQECVGK